MPSSIMSASRALFGFLLLPFARSSWPLLSLTMTGANMHRSFSAFDILFPGLIAAGLADTYLPQTHHCCLAVSHDPHSGDERFTDMGLKSGEVKFALERHLPLKCLLSPGSRVAQIPINPCS